MCLCAHMRGKPALPDSLPSRDRLARGRAPGCCNPVGGTSLDPMRIPKVPSQKTSSIRHHPNQVTGGCVQTMKSSLLLVWVVTILSMLNGQDEPEGKVAAKTKPKHKFPIRQRRGVFGCVRRAVIPS